MGSWQVRRGFMPLCPQYLAQSLAATGEHSGAYVESVPRELDGQMGGRMDGESVKWMLVASGNSGHFHPSFHGQTRYSDKSHEPPSLGSKSKVLA